MNNRVKVARSLAGLGCFILLASTALHLAGAYPRISTGLTASNLNAGLQSALRAVFLLIGWDWIVIAIIALIAAFTEARIRKSLVVFCGAALLVQAIVMVRFIGWFIGADMILASALLILAGGFAFTDSGP